MCTWWYSDVVADKPMFFVHQEGANLCVHEENDTVRTVTDVKRRKSFDVWCMSICFMPRTGYR